MAGQACPLDDQRRRSTAPLTSEEMAAEVTHLAELTECRRPGPRGRWLQGFYAQTQVTDTWSQLHSPQQISDWPPALPPSPLQDKDTGSIILFSMQGRDAVKASAPQNLSSLLDLPGASLPSKGPLHSF